MVDFYLCKRCKNLVALVNKGGGQLVCCNEPMQKLVPGESDGAVEKHVPVVNVEKNTVTVSVGATLHPMMEEHYIMWIALETTEGVLIKKRTPQDEPKAEFLLSEGEEAVCAYAYCNLHGLWKSEI